MNFSRKRFVLAAAVAAVALLFAALLREAGYLRLNLYRATLTSEVEVWKTYKSESPDKVLMSDKTREASTQTITDTRGWNFGFHTHPRRPGVRGEPSFKPILIGHSEFEWRVGEELAARFGCGDNVKVYPMRAVITGLDWMPFFKRGNCSYSLIWKSGIAAQGDGRIVHGELDFNVRGLLSQRDLEAMLAKIIADEALKIDNGG